MAKYEAENLTVSQEPIATFKLVLLGHTGVGKTSLLAKYTSGQFNYSLMTTIGLDFKDKVVNVDGIPIRMRIWDTAGQERFETLTVQYLRGAQGVILVFDLTSEHTYDRLLKWLDETINILYQDIPVVVVGNKIDLEDKRCVHPRVHLGEVKLRSNSYKYFETSCVTGENINKMFHAIGRLVAHHNGLYNPTLAGRVLARELSLYNSTISEGSLVLHDQPPRDQGKEQTDGKCCNKI